MCTHRQTNRQPRRHKQLTMMAPDVKASVTAMSTFSSPQVAVPFGTSSSLIWSPSSMVVPLYSPVKHTSREWAVSTRSMALAIISCTTANVPVGKHVCTCVKSQKMKALVGMESQKANKQGRNDITLLQSVVPSGLHLWTTGG